MIQRNFLICESVCQFMPKPFRGICSNIEYDGESKDKTVMYKR